MYGLWRYTQYKYKVNKHDENYKQQTAQGQNEFTAYVKWKIDIEVINVSKI